MKGLFITFEGVEGAGKSTQAKMLYEYFNNKKIKAILTKEPGGTKTGLKIREILLSHTDEKFTGISELFLYEADRNLHIENVIKPNLEKGINVICDRFIDSTLAYQGYARGLNIELIKQLNNIATNGLKPNITFLIDIPVEEGLKRIKNERNIDRIEKEDIYFHKRLREGFLKIAEEEKERIFVIDGTKDKKEIFKNILNILEKKFTNYLI
ncbi:dTMP kinase [Hydrogenothermus marinus]|uniref:Thymidylate kinase n=1 Tax=Hydrogenothermus marinus TaxID=133270 RepID=A0A3M0BL60_9AQUI|nr:dTMP kinase [Hydrogenothermus marinus]RMA97897.1 dTMP kinase [Hydrogenothermus marinus]